VIVVELDGKLGMIATIDCAFIGPTLAPLVRIHSEQNATIQARRLALADPYTGDGALL
jgi:hypothetical protein